MKNVFFLAAAGFLTTSLLAVPSACAEGPMTMPLKATQEGSAVSGTVTLQEVDGGLKVKVEVAGAPAGKHGLHFHENGSCADQGNAAGSHFNPDASMHGDVLKDGFEHAHAGDLGNIEIGADGRGTLEKTIPRLDLSRGKYGVSGRAVILHEKEDDFGQPTGNAGARIGCAVI